MSERLHNAVGTVAGVVAAALTWVYITVRESRDR